MPRVVSVNPADPLPARLAPAVELLAGGGLAALPTETFYGLAADALSGPAIARLRRVKGLDDRAPVLLLLGDLSQVALVADRLPALFDPLARRFWPGPLTLVVPASPRLPREVVGDGQSVGLRLPGLALPRRLAAGLGRPISGTSANRHGMPPCRSAHEVAASFADDVQLILDGGTTPGGSPSTILDLAGSRPRILRRGQVPFSALLPFLPDLENPASQP